MIALAVITLFLTGYAFVSYACISERSEKDMSFFLSVLMISMIVNLGTNAGGSFGMAWVYLIIAVLFIGLAFAVDLNATLGFYKSIGPWFKKTFSNAKLALLQILSLIIFPAGIALYFVDYKSKPEIAKACGRCSVFGILLVGLLLWAILGLAL